MKKKYHRCKSVQSRAKTREEDGMVKLVHNLSLLIMKREQEE